jgi:uncharacterized membrane protein YgdD (TMEM256/DUF423 family)
MIGVAAGAFGAHGLKRIVDADMLAIWHTAVLYQLALLATQIGAPLLGMAGAVMLAGVLIFSGSLYVLVLTGTKWLGAITPVGGMAFIIAWAMVAWAAWRAA